MSLLERFVGEVRRKALLAPGVRVVVACSGGADSTALAVLAAAAADELGLAAVALAHFDHALRADSAADARAVRALGRRLRLRTTVRRERVVAAAGESPEEAARRARYRFLVGAAGRAGASAVLTAHHLDDQAETVLFRALTGTGTSGLSGIRAVRPLDAGGSVRVVRPLLGFRREELRTFLREAGIPWRDDPTNRSGNVRARLRNEALPVLAACVGRDPAPLLARLAEHAAETTAAGAPLRDVASAFVEARPDGGFVVHAGFRRLPAGVRRTALREPVRILRGEAQPPSRAEVGRVDRAILGTGTGPLRGVRVRTRDDGSALLDRGDARPQPTPLPRLHHTVVPAGNSVFLERLRSGPGGMEIGDADAVGRPLTVRLPAPGDAFRPLGRDRPQRLAHYLQRRGLGAAERASVPLVCDPQGIVWVVGHGIAARAAVTESTERVLALRCERRAP